MVRLETTENRRRNMARIRSRDTGPELAFRKALREAGLTGYRKNLKGLPGTPDVVFTRFGRICMVWMCDCVWMWEKVS